MELTKLPRKGNREAQMRKGRDSKIDIDFTLNRCGILGHLGYGLTFRAQAQHDIQKVISTGMREA